MKRKKIETKTGKGITIEHDFNCYDLKICIDKFLEYLIEAKKNKATHIKFYGDTDRIDLQAINISLESDGPYKKRLSEEENRKALELELRQKRKRRMYEKLKAEFEN